MFKKTEYVQSEIIMYSWEELVPQESLYRKIDKYINFTFIYEKVKDLYSQNNGRNCVDPVVLFKLVFIQTIDGIKSMRKTCEKIKVNLEYRWFLGIPLGKVNPLLIRCFINAVFEQVTLIVISLSSFTDFLTSNIMLLNIKK